MNAESESAKADKLVNITSAKAGEATLRLRSSIVKNPTHKDGIRLKTQPHHTRHLLSNRGMGNRVPEPDYFFKGKKTEGAGTLHEIQWLGGNLPAPAPRPSGSPWRRRRPRGRLPWRREKNSKRAS